MSALLTKNLYSSLGEAAYTLYANPATRRYRDELRAIGRGFRRLIHGGPLDEETLAAINTLHVKHADESIALCRAFNRVVNFNYDPDWSDDSKFDASGHHIWPADGSEWRS